MHKTVPEATAFASALRSDSNLSIQKIEVVLAPPFTAVASLGEVLRGSGIGLAGQNLFYEEKGAYTGEISGGMLRDAGCGYVIIGHSERRRLFGETDETVNRKIGAALRHDLIPIFCLGETLEEREAGTTFQVIDRQLSGGLAGLSPEAASRLVIAYEPVWAIGTGRTATPEQAVEVHRHLRNRLRETFGEKTAEAIRIQYGGSVTPQNIAELMKDPDIDGALVGGASLQVDSFREIVYNAGKIKGVVP